MEQSESVVAIDRAGRESISVACGTLVRIRSNSGAVERRIPRDEVDFMERFAILASQESGSLDALGVFVRSQIDGRSPSLESMIAARHQGHLDDISRKIVIFALGLLVSSEKVWRLATQALRLGSGLISIDLGDRYMVIHLEGSSGHSVHTLPLCSDASIN